MPRSKIYPLDDERGNKNRSTMINCFCRWCWYCINLFRMLANRLASPALRELFSQPSFCFSAIGTHPPHSLPYAKRELGTIVQDFSGFSKIITKDLSSVVVIQNRSPAALHVLPPGFLKLRLNGETKNVADYYIHTGEWAVIHTYVSKNAAITQLRSILWTHSRKSFFE